MDALGDKVFLASEDSLTFMDGKLERLEARFQKVHWRVGLLSKETDDLSQQAAQSAAASLIKALDEEVHEPLKTAETWLDSTHAVAVSVGNISEAIVSSKYADTQEDSAGVAMAGQVQDVSDAVVEILATLQEARQKLIDIRDNVVSTRQIALTIVARLAQVEKRMVNLCERIEKLRGRLVEMKGEVASAKDNLRWWMAFGAVLITLLLIWFATSQIGMVLHGWVLAKRRPIVIE
jgi:chromosome segregation ATPase